LGYENDVFLSFTRGGANQTWVQNHFERVLTESLENEMSRQPKVYAYYAQGTGVAWPDNVQYQLKRSRLMVAMFSPPYFRSEWCVAELASMREREKLCGLATPEHPEQLVHTVVLADGVLFPEAARAMHAQDFKDWFYPDAVFQDSPKFLGFRDAVRDLATTIAQRVDAVPDFADWPVYKPDTAPDVSAPLPRMV